MSEVQNMETKSYRELFQAWMADPKQYKGRLLAKQYEVTGKQVDLTDAQGGFAQPEELRNLAQNVANKVNHARILAGVTPSPSSKYRAALADEFGATWVGETDTRTESSTGQFRTQNPTFGEVTALAVATEWALDDMVQGDEWLIQGLESEFAGLETKAFISGTGTNQPSGMLLNNPTADPDSSRDTNTYQSANIGAAGSITAESLAGLLTSLPDEYLAAPQACAWLMHPDVYAEVRELDTSLRAPTRDGAISTFMDLNCFISGEMPAPGAGSFSVAVGNFADGYIFVERAPGMRITRDAVTDVGKVRFYGRRVVGGQVLNNRAIRFGALA